jgi:hypothetical protein
VLYQSKTRALSKGHKTRATDLLSRTMLTKCKLDRRFSVAAAAVVSENSYLTLWQS